MPYTHTTPSTAPIQKVDHDLYLIPLPQPLKGFDRFISSWLVTGEQNLLIDVGPSGSVEFLFSALDALGISRIDAILLTHIHIDHSGGIGEVSARFPETPIFCHPKAIKHLAAPQALWEGSLKTLGDRARTYGPISSVPQDRISDVLATGYRDVEVIDTPGHAPHHVSYRIGDNLFVGEAGGVYQALSDQKFYMRPATPPKFFLETNLNSIDRLMALPSKRLCYGHFGMTEQPAAMLTQHRDQLLRWRDIISDVIDKVDGGNGYDEQAILNRLLTSDPLLSSWETLGEANQDREHGFLMNSIRGYLGYLRQGSA